MLIITWERRPSAAETLLDTGLDNSTDAYSCLHNSRHETFHFEKKKMSRELDISVNFVRNDLNLFLSYSLKNRLVHHNKILLI